jgi:hypothetical protein
VRYLDDRFDICFVERDGKRRDTVLLGFKVPPLRLAFQEVLGFEEQRIFTLKDASGVPLVYEERGPDVI